MVSVMDVSQIRQHIEDLVAEEHKLLDEAGEDGLAGDKHQRLHHIQKELDDTWDLLRRREAGQSERLADADVPDPPNEFDYDQSDS
jgi:hypothetical protein